MATKPARNRRKIARQIDIPHDVFLAASVGDLDWFRHSVSGTNYKTEIPYDLNGFSPLHIAAANARLDCIRYMIEKMEYDVNLRSKIHGWLPIQVVLNHLNDDRTLPCLKYLISKGALINGANAEGTTALHQAAAEGDTESIKILLDRGANPFLEDARGCTPLQLTKIWGHREAARAIENAIWRLKKQEDGKSKQAALEGQKVLAIEDLKSVVEKFSSQEENVSNVGNWMRNHGLDDFSVKHTKIKRDKSVHPGRRMQNYIPDAPESPFSKPRTEAVNRKHPVSPQPGKRHGEENEELPTAQDIKGMSVEQLRAFHNNPWVKSTKVGEPDYVPNLKDIYPRDEYTNTPTKFSTPFLTVGDIREVKTMDVINEPMRQIRYEGKGPPLSARRYGPSNRPNVWKAFKNVIDVPPLRKPNEACFLRDEAALHLVNDPKSLLFKFALQPAVVAVDYKKIYAEV